MEEKKLRLLLADLSQQEKIGQLLQLDGAFLAGSDTFATGPAHQLGLEESDRWLCGSVLNVRGADAVRALQKDYMEHQPHHIPLLFMLDVINGYRTVFPVPLAQGCTFAPELLRAGARITAQEASADGVQLTFSPMADLVTDSRWGRVMESTGEDPLLNSLCAAALVKGYQDEDLSRPGTLAACVKHFAAYGRPDAGREYANVELSTHTLYEDYLPAYRAAIKAGAATVMTSFNTLDRVPSTANRHLMCDILREEMGFDGVLISDYAAIAELMAHGIAEDAKKAAALAMQATVDIDMMSSCYVRNLADLLQSGTLPQSLLDDAVFRILQLKNRLGLFEDPYHGAEETPRFLSPESRRTAREMATKSMVLLKNEAEILPLSKKSGKVALIGPYCNTSELYGAWSMQAEAEDTVTVQQAIAEAGISAQCYPGCAMLTPGTVLEGLGGFYTERVTEEENRAMQEQAIAAAKAADTVVLCLGEHRFQSGEGGSQVKMRLPLGQRKLLQQVCAINSNVILVLFSGRPMEIAEEAEACAAVLAAWMPGTEGGHAVVDLLWGRAMPEGRLSMCFPRSAGQLPLSYRALSSGRPLLPGSKGRFLSRYQDVENTPLYPFGYGLCYTTFSYTKPNLSAQVLHPGETLTARVTVTNTGTRTATETVQLYVQDCFGSVCRPMRELKAFAKATLEPGESREIAFEITEEMLRYYTLDFTHCSEPGTFRLWIGANSACDDAVEFALA